MEQGPILPTTNGKIGPCFHITPASPDTLLVSRPISEFNLPERNTMKSWLGTSLLLPTSLASRCTRSEPKQALAANEKSAAAPNPTLPVAMNGEGDAARSGGKGDDATPKSGAKPGRKFALLVGVTKYDTLKVNQLIGPANDVVLMSKMLKDRYHFTDKDIVILADCPGASGRPTRANIESHFERLNKEAKAGDQMVILLGGHGDLQPEQEQEPVDKQP